jgi:pyruvate/2-oxoglutarate dehydrogenase complex dihydrolipoamide dehydrogenase (E3) component
MTTDDFRVVQSQFLGDGSYRRGEIIPDGMFTSPELGRVGMSEAESVANGCKYPAKTHRPDLRQRPVLLADSINRLSPAPFHGTRLGNSDFVLHMEE